MITTWRWISCSRNAWRRAEDLARLPPAFVSVGALDLFLEENLEYARRLTRAGVPTELHVWPGAFDAFEAMPDNRVAVFPHPSGLIGAYRELRRLAPISPAK